MATLWVTTSNHNKSVNNDSVQIQCPSLLFAMLRMIIAILLVSRNWQHAAAAAEKCNKDGGSSPSLENACNSRGSLSFAGKLERPNRAVGSTSRKISHVRPPCCKAHMHLSSAQVYALVTEPRKLLGKHKKIIGEIMAIIMAMFGPIIVKMYLNNISNCLIVFSASIWYNQIPISLF